MTDLEFWHDWLFYGGLFAALGAGIHAYILGKKVGGVGNLNWKQNTLVYKYMVSSEHSLAIFSRSLLDTSAI